MSQTPAKPTLPTSIILGGITYNVTETQELKDFIAQVSQVEKNKLYSTIDELKKGIEELKRVDVHTPAPTVAPTVAQPINEKAFKDEVISAVGTLLNERLAPITAALNQAQAESVDAYRDRLVNANVGKCIPDIVKGNTKEEVDASLAESIRLRSQYSPVDFNQPGGQENKHANIPAEVQAAAANANVPGATQVAAPTIMAPAVISAIEESPVDIAGMNHEEFGKRRGELEAKMKNLVG